MKGVCSEYMKRDEFEKIIELYSIYGFEVAKTEEKCIVFTFSNGYFLNCEIVENGLTEKEKEEYKSQYDQLGYATRIVSFVSIDDAHEKLYTGFFNIAFSKRKSVQEYERFVEQQTQKIFSFMNNGNKYSYVMGRYYEGNISYGTSVVEAIYERINSRGAQLIFVEAAAGFGKTCTSYEVLNRIARDSSTDVPIFIELSKNRNAKVFRHVLLDAIDRNFAYLSSKVVQYEIKNGKIPLIVDGFDELLSKTINEGIHNGNIVEDKSDAQNMLATIAELLGDDSSAKIILTSRKSSLFTGEEFDEWLINNLQDCDVTRYMLEEPTLINWLGHEKVKYIEEKSIPFQSISNPIILCIYASMSYQEFTEKCENVESVLDEYFSCIMKREQQRQSLLLEVEEQYDIMIYLAKNFVEFGITSDETKLIKEIFEMILGKDAIVGYLKRYEDKLYNEERPNEDEFLRKLVYHALLDRKSQDLQVIGFINDFVFGIFIGEAILHDLVDLEKIGNEYIELAATSYAVKSKENRQKLYQKLKFIYDRLDTGQQIMLDINLCGKTAGNYEMGYINSFTFPSKFIIEKEHVFTNVCFNQCVFNQITFYAESFDKCQFIGCVFFECEFIQESSCESDIQFIACEGVDKWSKVKDEVEEQKKDYCRIVLEQYWRPGRANADPRHTYRTLLKGLSTSEYNLVDEAISTLKKKDFLSVKGSYLALNYKKINEIKEVLGRQ